MFTIFVKKEIKDHVCYPVNLDYMSAFKNLTDLTLIKQLPYKNEKLESRAMELYEMN